MICHLHDKHISFMVNIRLSDENVMKSLRIGNQILRGLKGMVRRGSSDDANTQMHMPITYPEHAVYLHDAAIPGKETEIVAPTVPEQAM